MTRSQDSGERQWKTNFMKMAKIELPSLTMMENFRIKLNDKISSWISSRYNFKCFNFGQTRKIPVVLPMVSHKSANRRKNIFLCLLFIFWSFDKVFLREWTFVPSSARTSWLDVLGKYLCLVEMCNRFNESRLN